VDKIGLRVNGLEYGGWKSARVTRSIEAIAGSFELSVSERWDGQDKPWPIIEEDECVLVLENTPVIVGYVDKRSLSYGPKEHTLSVSGRDQTGDLVDCSAILDKWEFRNVSALTLAERIAEPFGISVSLQEGVVLPKSPAKFSVDPGESAFDVIEKACRTAGLLAVSDGSGGLLLTRTGSARATTELVRGQNILAASAEFDAAARFRHYRVLGQHQGTDELSGTSAAAVKGTAEDLNVRRSARSLLIRPEGNVTQAQAKVRAQWEATVRAARADAVSITVQGWTQADGTLWPINALARVRDSFLGIDGDLLITQAAYSVGPEGTTTELTLKRPDSFKPEATITTQSTGLWKEISRGV
jgi:prophage tail gpP-like protein